MGSKGRHHLSLLARFDDVCRTDLPLINALNQQSPGWSKFLAAELNFRQTLRQDNQNVEALKRELQTERNEKRKLEITLAQVRRELEDSLDERRRVQIESDQLARQLQMIKELVTNKNNQSYNLLTEEDRKKLDFLNNSAHYGSPSMMDTALLEDSVSIDEDEYDKTGDDILTRSRRRRSKRKSAAQRLSSQRPRLDSQATLKRYPVSPSAPPESEETNEEKTPPKRRRVAPQPPSSLGRAPLATTDETTDDELRAPPNALRRSARLADRGRRSLSVGAPIDEDDVDTDSFFDIDTGRRITQAQTQPRGIMRPVGPRDASPSPSLDSSPTIKRWASAGRLRAHNLITKSVIKPEMCQPCGKKIKFGRSALKCKDCRAACHVECRDSMSAVCIPTDSTPTKGTQGTSISDFAPVEPPFVPAIILQCVNEVESRGFYEEGIYRKSGSDREVKELKERFVRGKDPRLDTIMDIHVVCGCLKDFLRHLKEPLIPTALWRLFVDAAETRDERRKVDAVGSAVGELPPVNKDCIAFLIIHLQRVSERPDTRMTTDNLAKVFGPTIVGYSLPQPEPNQMIAEVTHQQMVMTALLEMTTDYWTDILSGNRTMSSDDNRYIETPEGRKPPARDARSTAKVKQFFGESPRYPRPTSKSKAFFPSPMLK